MVKSIRDIDYERPSGFTEEEMLFILFGEEEPQKDEDFIYLVELEGEKK